MGYTVCLRLDTGGSGNRRPGSNRVYAKSTLICLARLYCYGVRVTIGLLGALLVSNMYGVGKDHESENTLVD